MLHDPELVAEVFAWLRKADEDLSAARVLAAASPPLPELALYHCQQAVEEAIKGFLVWHGRRFRKTHSIEEIGEQAIDIDARLMPLIDKAAPLSMYTWMTRYPTDTIINGCMRPDQGIDTAEEVLGAIRDRLAMKADETQAP